ncbi:MAG: polyphenol oxidase family protein [Endomicrobiia bacterium]
MWKNIKNDLIFFKSEENSPDIFFTTKSFINKVINDTFDEEELKINDDIKISEYKIKSLLGLVREINLPKESFLIFYEQTHSNNVKFVEKDIDLCNKIKVGNNLYNFKFYPLIDGVITNIKNSIIFVFTADCIPFFVYDEEERYIGLIHIGRRGVEKGIVKNILSLFILKGKNITKKLKFVIGPHICSSCYIVDGKKYSLVEEIKRNLKEFEIKENQVIISPYCTSCNNDIFYSYRKDSKTELRIISAITYLPIFEYFKSAEVPT